MSLALRLPWAPALLRATAPTPPGPPVPAGTPAGILDAAAVVVEPWDDVLALPDADTEVRLAPGSAQRVLTVGLRDTGLTGAAALISTPSRAAGVVDLLHADGRPVVGATGLACAPVPGVPGTWAAVLPATAGVEVGHVYRLRLTWTAGAVALVLERRALGMRYAGNG